MNDQTTSNVVTAAQKTAFMVAGGGVGLTMADVTALLSFIGALTSAVAGCWVLWDRWRDKRRNKTKNAGSGREGDGV